MYVPDEPEQAGGGIARHMQALALVADDDDVLPTAPVGSQKRRRITQLSPNFATFHKLSNGSGFTRIHCFDDRSMWEDETGRHDPCTSAALQDEDVFHGAFIIMFRSGVETHATFICSVDFVWLC
jgi:hypothetical protein